MSSEPDWKALAVEGDKTLDQLAQKEKCRRHLITFADKLQDLGFEYPLVNEYDIPIKDAVFQAARILYAAVGMDEERIRKE